MYELIPAKRFLNKFWGNENWFESFESMVETFIEKNVYPSSYKKDKDGNLIYEFDMPGVGSEDLNVTIEDNHSIKIEAKVGEREYSHRIDVGQIDPNKIEAKIDKGILTLIKRVEKPKELKKIAVK